jgi:hypothetical protein
MDTVGFPAAAGIEHATLRTAHVSSLQDGGSVVVRLEGSTDELDCELLAGAGQASGQLRIGDQVLIWHSGNREQRGVVLGRVGRDRPHENLERDATPDELVIEAKHSLTLRVGSGSITIREDGKILIKGKDLVSHAQRLNRIKGGAVQIN